MSKSKNHAACQMPTVAQQHALVVPKSLVVLIPAIFILLFLVLTSITMWIFGNGAGPKLQITTVVVFGISVIAGLFFWRDLPNFKISMQAFMSSTKREMVRMP